MTRHYTVLSLSFGLLTAFVDLLSLAPSVAFGQTAATSACHLTFSSPLFIPISGTLQELVIDPQCQHVFVTDATTNRVDVISLVSGRLGAPIDVGSDPTGIDITPDGSTLYVATAGTYALSIVNVAQNVQSGTIPIAPFLNVGDTPFSIAIANNGLAILSTTFRILRLNLATGAVTGFSNGTESMVRASSDRSAISLIHGDSSIGPVNAYLAATNQFTNTKGTAGYLLRAAINNGVILANNMELGLNGSTLQQVGVLPTVANWQLLDVAVDPTGHVGYRSGYNIYSGGPNSLDVLDLQRLLVTGSLPLGDTVGSNLGTTINQLAEGGPGHMALSSDGALLAVITDHGVSLVQPNPTSFVQFTKFGASVDLVSSPTTGSLRLQIEGSFMPGTSGNVDIAHQDFTLNIGASSITIPAGSFVYDHGRYGFHGNMLSATVQPGKAGGYGFVVVATGVSTNDWSLPIPVTLMIGTNEGSTTLVNTQALFDTPGTAQ